MADSVTTEEKAKSFFNGNGQTRFMKELDLEEGGSNWQNLES
jgi:hypothetical protein